MALNVSTAQRTGRTPEAGHAEQAAAIPISPMVRRKSSARSPAFLAST